MMDLNTLLQIVVAAVALGGLVLGISKWRSRKNLEKRLFKSALTLQSRVSNSRFKSVLWNQAQSSVRLKNISLFVENEGYQLDNLVALPQILTKIGLSSPPELELDVHCFGLPQIILPQSNFYLISAEFEQSDSVIFKALQKVSVKLTTVSPLGVEKTKVIKLVPN